MMPHQPLADCGRTIGTPNVATQHEFLAVLLYTPMCKTQDLLTPFLGSEECDCLYNDLV
jgi:hypothetical protein